MYCKNCGTNINQGESFCRSCGTKVELNQPPTNNIHNANYQTNQSYTPTSNAYYQQNQTYGSTNNTYQVNNQQYPQSNGTYQQQNVAPTQGMPQQQVNVSSRAYQPQSQLTNDNNDEVLIDAYIGKNAHKIIPGKFSLCAFLIGLPYYIYRKMWGLLLISIAITIISTIFLPALVSIITIVEGIIFAKNFNTWYWEHAERKVAKIQNKNPGSSLEKLSAICKKKGGTSILSVVIFFLMIIGLISFIGLSANNSTKKETTPTRIQHRELHLELLDEFYEMDYDISLFPSEMTSSYIYRPTKQDYCKLEVNFRGDMSQQEYIENKINTNNAPTTKTINGNTWYYINDINQDENVHHYIIEVSENVFHIEFIILKDGGKCSKNHKKLLQTLEIENDQS